MARKRRTTAAEEWMSLVARLPWWVGVGLAGVSYLLLHRLATPVDMPIPTPGQMVGPIVKVAIASVALFAQYLVPLICLAGAGLSAWKRRRGQALVRDVQASRHVEALNGMSWREFEQLVAAAYRQQGYRVTETGGGGPDGGVDVVLKKGSETFLVQCKQWKALKVSVDVVRQLYGVMAARGAAGGFVVTSGQFTADAHAFAQGRNIMLVDGPALKGLIQSGRQASVTPPPAPVTARAMAPVCPKCDGAMTKRVAKQGANAGREFWGCLGYPGCRGVLRL